MSERVVLHYFNGRGKMEAVRWLLAAAGVQVCCVESGEVFHVDAIKWNLRYIYI